MTTQITHIHHSCFVAEDDRALLVFDYWQDPYNKLHAILNDTHKEVYFIVSHFHDDHFNPEILTLPGKHIISYDTKKRRRIADDQATAVMRPDETYDDGTLKIEAFKSTDVGLCYLATLPNGETVFHAGDYNNWYFERGDEHLKVSAHEMEGLYLSILKKIKASSPHIDHVMFPVDPRLEEHTIRGTRQWLKAIDTTHLYPMHHWGLDTAPHLAQLHDEFPAVTIHADNL